MNKETLGRKKAIDALETLKLLSNGKVLKSFQIALGKNPIGRKHLQGDHKTPEGNLYA